VIEFYPTREEAEAEMAAILSDEPSWAPKLEIVRVDFSGDELRIWPAATKESRIG
jgi:hypothetical protein